MAAWLRNCIERAAQTLGYEHLKPEQLEAMEGFLTGHDVFVVLPTGYGKTVCYSYLPLANDLYQDTTGSLITVVSPLIALMADQVTSLSKRGVSTASISPGLNDNSISSINSGNFSVLFVSLELIVGKWRKLLKIKTYQEKFLGLVIDEAHCVMKW